MSFPFPATPAVGDTYTGPNTAIYTWDGVKWTSDLSAATGFLPITGGTLTGPVNVPPGASGAEVPRAGEVLGLQDGNSLPKTDPGISGNLWNDNGQVKVSV